MILKALQIYGGRLLGIFSDAEKAVRAANEQGKLYGGVWAVEAGEAEVLIRCTDGTLLQITDWQVDRALVDGEWVQL